MQILRQPSAAVATSREGHRSGPAVRLQRCVRQALPLHACGAASEGQVSPLRPEPGPVRLTLKAPIVCIPPRHSGRGCTETMKRLPLKTRWPKECKDTKFVFIKDADFCVTRESGSAISLSVRLRQRCDKHGPKRQQQRFVSEGFAFYVFSCRRRHQPGTRLPAPPQSQRLGENADLNFMTVTPYTDRRDDLLTKYPCQ